MPNEMLHPCIHSKHDPGCIGCWEHRARHAEKYGQRLRKALDALVQPHVFVGGTDKPWDECEVCILFRDRHGQEGTVSTSDDDR